ncbi:MAG: polyprenyl diphosphate synthase [Candidatus Aenigmatarchaeota archaeon]|nr:di-trans,poly-cis-decaprenylcistransferase [Candidatus Aenigmarchaeota archaeon]
MVKPVQDIHLAIIPDGNRRWAKKHGKPEWYGHVAGARKLREVAKWCEKHPEIKTLTVYALSTENLQRDGGELSRLWNIYRDHFREIANSPETRKRKVRVNIIGNSATWRPDVREAAREVMRATRHYTGSVLNILLAYGSQYEIVNAVKKVVKAGVSKLPLVPELFNKALMITRPVDIIIRTGGEHRLSNFLLFQAAYAEIYFSNTLWPDFSRAEFERILRDYKKTNRRFGR